MKGIIPAIILAAVIPLRMAADQHLPSHPMTPAQETSQQDTTGIYGGKERQPGGHGLHIKAGR